MSAPSGEDRKAMSADDPRMILADRIIEDLERKAAEDAKASLLDVAAGLRPRPERMRSPLPIGPSVLVLEICQASHFREFAEHELKAARSEYENRLAISTAARRIADGMEGQGTFFFGDYIPSGRLL